MPSKEPQSEDWSADDLGEQSSYEGTTEMKQRLRRKDETFADPNSRDVAGAVAEKDTAQGRELSRKRTEPVAEKSDEEINRASTSHD